MVLFADPAGIVELPGTVAGLVVTGTFELASEPRLDRFGSRAELGFPGTFADGVVIGGLLAGSMSGFCMIGAGGLPDCGIG